MSDKVAVERDAEMAASMDLPSRAFPLTNGCRESRFQAVCRQSVLNEIYRHGASTREIEICGVLVGDAYMDDRGPFLYIEASIRGEHASNLAAQVTFTAATWSHIHECMEKHPGKKIVGWYHTHPGFGIFLSAADMFIHDNFFDVPWQVAFVYDPLSHEEGMFYWRAGKAVQEPVLAEQDAPAETDGMRVQEICQAQPKSATDPLTARVEKLERRLARLIVAMTLVVLLTLAWPWVQPQILSYFGQADSGDPPAPSPNVEDTAK